MMHPLVLIAIGWVLLISGIVLVLRGLAKRNRELDLYSNCCGAKCDGELYEYEGKYTGRCARCKDNALFLTLEDER